jgi:hypothetical protein
MEATVGMLKRQHQLGRSLLASDAHDNAVDRALAFAEAGVGIGVVGPGTVGTYGLVAASDQLVVHRGLPDTR